MTMMPPGPAPVAYPSFAPIMQYKTKTRAALSRDLPTEKEYLQVQTCLACCGDDVDGWVLAQNKYGTRLVRSWEVTFDRQLWDKWIVPALVLHAQLLACVCATLDCGDKPNWEGVEGQCRKNGAWTAIFVCQLKASMSAHCTLRKDCTIPPDIFHTLHPRQPTIQ